MLAPSTLLLLLLLFPARPHQDGVVVVAGGTPLPDTRLFPL
jgi:hypothetical protein